MMNKFGGSGQDDENDKYKTESMRIDMDQAALVNHRLVEAVSAEDNHGASVVLGMGHQLQAGRIACNLSIEDVSRQLRLSAKQVEALEREDFDKLPVGTFLRGFIRNYANLVKLDSKPMLQSLPTPAATTHTTLNPIYPPRATSFSSDWAWNRQNYRNGRKQGGPAKVVFLVLPLLIIYGIYNSVNWGQLPLINNGTEAEAVRSIETEVINGQSVIELQLPISSMISPDDTTQSAQTMGVGDNLKQKQFSSVDSLPAAISNSNSESSGLGTMNFKFAGDSWVEVKDRANTVVFKQINAGGTEQVVSGKRPLTLVIGNASRVDLIYNDREIDLTPYTNKSAGIARLTLE